MLSFQVHCAISCNIYLCTTILNAQAFGSSTYTTRGCNVQRFSCVNIAYITKFRNTSIVNLILTTYNITNSSNVNLFSSKTTDNEVFVQYKTLRNKSTRCFCIRGSPHFHILVQVKISSSISINLTIVQQANQCINITSTAFQSNIVANNSRSYYVSATILFSAINTFMCQQANIATGNDLTKIHSRIFCNHIYIFSIRRD